MYIPLGIRTEYSFKHAFASISEIAKLDYPIIGIADDNNTFGHIPFIKAMKKEGKTPILGVRLTVAKELKERFEYKGFTTVLLARNNRGLREIYRLVSLAWEQFYYSPKISLEQYMAIDTNDIIILHNAHSSYGIKKGFPFVNHTTHPDLLSRNSVYIDNNLYINPDDIDVYQLMAGSAKRGESRMYNFDNTIESAHVLTEDEVIHYFGNDVADNNSKVARQCNANIEPADMIKWSGKLTLDKACSDGIAKRKMPDTDEYHDRLEYELKLIKSKKYDDYFLIVADLCNWAKNNGILVGPSRGSSAGSLVCYLMGITEVDPIKHNLLFERFIDINRFDLPDIDIDFPDDKKELIFKYLVKQYGKEHVASLANINRFKAKYAIGEFAAALGILPYETEELKNSIIERSGGDARAAMCIEDTINGTDVGKNFIAKYPAMKLVSKIENHASHAGKHAAGILVSTLPLTNYGSVNSREGILMMDKKDAEHINLLKIDALGLRTLTIIADTCKQIGMKFSAVYDIPLDDQKTFALFNDMRLNGIFQFEGQALRIITKQMGVHEFSDIVAITALARPGALNSGGTARYVKYKTGLETPVYRSEEHKRITEESLGIVIYQEQMMAMTKDIGDMSWEDVSDLRRASSKTMGDEFFSTYKEKFMVGALKKNSVEDAEQLWHDISATGSWTFNKAHAVSYGLVSYWTAWFKANYPLEFAVANLNHVKDTDSAIRLLRDFTENDGIEYCAVDPDESDVNWTVKDGKLLGGITNIAGIGESKAKKVIADRKAGRKFTLSIMSKLLSPKTDFDNLFPIRSRFQDWYINPENYGIDGKISLIKDVINKGNFIIIGKVVKRDLRDRNDYQAVTKRGGTRVETNQFYIKFIIEDDTDSIMCMVSHMDYEKLGGASLAEEMKENTIVIIKGKIKSDWRMITIDQIVNLEGY